MTTTTFTAPHPPVASPVEALPDGAIVTIHAPLQQVWDYASDSRQATAWSVYFHHISPRPTGALPDGTVGSERVCYRRADETGVAWDEQVLALEPHGSRRLRRICTYNLRGFGLLRDRLAGHTAYTVEQAYQRIDATQTTLAFRTWMAQPAHAPARVVFDRFVRPEVIRIFALNLENIKAAIEAAYRGTPYVRVHPYEAHHPWD